MVTETKLAIVEGQEPEHGGVTCKGAGGPFPDRGHVLYPNCGVAHDEAWQVNLFTSNGCISLYITVSSIKAA
jgi:hypothetical protein